MDPRPDAIFRDIYEICCNIRETGTYSMERKPGGGRGAGGGGGDTRFVSGDEFSI